MGWFSSQGIWRKGEGESAEEDSHGRSPMPGVDLPPTTAATASGVSRPKYSPSQNYSPIPIQGNLRAYEPSDSEFSTVPLTSSDSNSRISRLLKQWKFVKPCN